MEGVFTVEEFHEALDKLERINKNKGKYCYTLAGKIGIGNSPSEAANNLIDQFFDESGKESSQGKSKKKPERIEVEVVTVDQDGDFSDDLPF